MQFTKEQLIAHTGALIESQRQCISGANDPENVCTYEMDVAVLEIALAALTTEPVAWTDEQELQDVAKDGLGYLFTVNPITPNADPRRVIKLYRHAQPVPERDLVRRDHAEWSQDTFGDVGPVGPLKHLSKEALEAAAAPEDLSEWADMQFLLWDAQRRAGISDEQITQAMVEKLAVNKQREWPEPKDGEPRLHIKELPAPVAINGLLPCPFCGGKAQQLTIEQDNDPHFGGDVITCTECGASSHVEFGFKENLKSAWNSRAAMLQAGNGSTVGKVLTITLPHTSSKAFWSGTGKNEVFHPGTYNRWVKEAIERACVISGIAVEVK